MQLAVTAEEITLTTAGLGTYASDVDLDFTEVEGLSAYIAKENETKIELQRVNKIPAGTGVLLRSTNEGTDYVVPVATSTDDVTGNLFVRGTGAAVASDDGGSTYNYVLGRHDGVIGFYKAGGMTVATNKAYLQTTVAAARIDLSFDDNETGITNNKYETINRYYNLQGQSVAKPARGLYIVNGKKVVIK